MNNICLIVIFNHKYIGNVEKLRFYYKNKFESIYFVMPFYKGEDKDVISVYESSYQFEGYFAQAYNRFYNNKYTHYVFIGDDLLLNPNINEENICELFHLKENCGYIHSLTKLSQMHQWTYKRFQEVDQVFKSIGVNYKDEIPSLEQAEETGKQQGMSDFTIKYVKYYHEDGWKRKIKAWLLNNFTNMNITYPLVAGYSDIVIVPKESIERFCHISGVFAAMNLFVEIAVPTTMMLTCKNIVTSKQISLKAEEMWELEKYIDIIEKLGNDSQYNLQNISKYFPEKYAYLHPVKLSQWHGINANGKR